MSRRSRPEPHEVFTPGDLPLERHNVYSPREEPERSLARYRNRRQIPIVYGDYGVGKTSLVRKFFQAEDRAGKLVYFPSSAGLTISAVFTRILELLDYEVETESSTSRRTGVEGGIDRVIRAVARREKTEERHRQLVVSAPTDTAMLDIIDEAELIVVVDEMHRASNELRLELANFIKAVKSAGKKHPTLVLVGTTMDAERLVAHDPGIDRYIKEVPVPLMSEEEALFIIKEGFQRLGLRIPEELAVRIVVSAAGAPTIVHALCLDAAESAIDDGRDDVSEGDCKAAVLAYLNDHGRRLAGAYLRAIETVGPKRYRKQVLHAVANTDSDYATMDDIRTWVSANLGEDTPSTALSGPLRALKEPEYGAILQDVERFVGGNRVHNLTAFTDPMMKSFVRFMGNVDNTSLMPSPSELRTIEEAES